MPHQQLVQYATQSQSQVAPVKEKPAPLQPAEPEILSAVESLYADELKPFGRILRKRLLERAQAAGSEAVEVDGDLLIKTCEACVALAVQSEDGGEWSTQLVGREPTFGDVYSPVDDYPGALWAAAAVYFASPDGIGTVLPGGRYACAQALLAEGLPFLKGYSLGRVCHIVQLAISRWKLLGYLHGSVVPYSRSQSMLKECCAGWQQPCKAPAATGASAAPELPLASLDMARSCLREILMAAGSDGIPGPVPLSNVKRLFRSRYHLELSETLLGHVKLTGLLLDPRFQDICTVELQGHGYMVIPQDPPAQQPPTRICLADELDMSPPAPVSSTEQALPERRVAFCQDEPLCLEHAGFGSCLQGSAPLAAPRWPALSPSTAFFEDGFSAPAAGTHMPAQSPSAAFFGDGHSFVPALQPVLELLSGDGQKFDTTSELGSEPDSAGDSAERPRRTVFCPDEPLCLEDAGLSLGAPNGVATPASLLAPAVRRWPAFSPSTAFFEDGRSATPVVPQMPALSPSAAFFEGRGGAVRTCSTPQRAHASRVSPYGIPAQRLSPTKVSKNSELDRRLDSAGFSEEPQRRAVFCPDEPLWLEEAGVESLLAPASQKLPALSPFTLSKEGRIGSIVQNTFIHCAPALPTPLRRAPRRARSLPRDMGSGKSDWEGACHVLGFRQQAVCKGGASGGDSDSDGCSARSRSPRPSDAAVRRRLVPPSPSVAGPPAPQGAADLAGLTDFLRGHLGIKGCA